MMINETTIGNRKITLRRVADRFIVKSVNTETNTTVYLSSFRDQSVASGAYLIETEQAEALLGR